MIFFKKDPVKELKKLLEELKVPQELLWHRTNQEDLYHIVEILEKELPKLEGATLAEAEEHPDVRQNPLFKTIVQLFSDINRLASRFKGYKKRKQAVNPAELKREYDLLDELLSTILREEYLWLEEKSSQPQIPQEIADADAQELAKAGWGKEVKFIISPMKAKFWTDPRINHPDVAVEQFGRAVECSGTILPDRRLIDVPKDHSTYDHDQALMLFRKLGASDKTKVLHGFLIRHKGAYLGRFICKYGGLGKITPEKEIIAILPYGGARDTVLRLLKDAEARKDGAAIEKYRKMLRELTPGD